MMTTMMMMLMVVLVVIHLKQSACPNAQRPQ